MSHTMSKVRGCTCVEYLLAATLLLAHYVAWKSYTSRGSLSGYLYLYVMYMWSLGMPSLAVACRSRVLMAFTVICMATLMIWTVNDVRKTSLKLTNVVEFVYAIAVTIMSVDLCLLYDRETRERNLALNEIYLNDHV